MTEVDFSGLLPDLMLDAIEITGVKCDGSMLALNSYENRVYRIGLEDSDPVVAKFYRPQRWSDETILEEHLFSQELADQDIPVIPPIVNTDGHSLHHFKGYRFALYPNRGGRSLELDDGELLQQLGRLIGRMHSIGASDCFKFRPKFDLDSFIDKPANLVAAEFMPDYLKEAYTSLIRDCRQGVEVGFERAGSFNQIRLHGDCHPGNILVTDAGPHMVDLDDARSGPAIQDLWMFLSGEREYMEQRLANLLAGYTQFYHFNPLELGLIEVLRTMRIIHYAGWLALRWNDSAFKLAFPWFNTPRYWEEHILTLREQISNMQEPPLQWME